MKKVLFICTGNSCRSIMAEYILSKLGSGKFESYSCGSSPIGVVNPITLQTIERHGANPEDFSSKSWNDFKNKGIDISITVCGAAQSETCPIFLDSTIKAHWDTFDPTGFVAESKEELAAEFDRVYKIMEQRIQSMIELPMDEMSDDEIARHLNEIGEKIS